MTNSVKQFICINWGTKYGADYVNRLYGMVARNPSNPLEKLGQTSVYRFPVGKLLPLLERFAKSPLEIAEQYKYEQRYVTRNAPGGVKFWPKSWVLHFRQQCRRTFPFNYFKVSKLPDNSKLVIFPGDLNPMDAIEGRYHAGDDVLTAAEHLKAGFRGQRNRSLMAHLRHFILPTAWVEQYWKE